MPHLQGRVGSLESDSLSSALLNMEGGCSSAVRVFIHNQPPGPGNIFYLKFLSFKCVGPCMIFDFLRRMFSGDRNGEPGPENTDENESNTNERENNPEEVMNTIEQLLSDFGFDAEEVRNAYEYMLDLDLAEGKTVSEYITENDEQLAGQLDGLDGSLGFFVLHSIIRWSPRGIFSDWRYTEETAEYQINRALDSQGYEVRMEYTDGERIDVVEDTDEEFIIEGRDRDEVVTETRFRYPDTDLGVANYAALIGAINQNLLHETNFRFHQLDSTGDDWSFILLQDETYDGIVEKHGIPVEIFGRTLLLDEITDEVQYL